MPRLNVGTVNEGGEHIFMTLELEKCDCGEHNYMNGVEIMVSLMCLSLTLLQNFDFDFYFPEKPLDLFFGRNKEAKKNLNQFKK